MALQDETDVDSNKKTIIEFMERYKNLENEKSEISDRMKDLKEEYSDRIDMKILRKAITYVKAESSVAHKFEFDTIVDVLRTEFPAL